MSDGVKTISRKKLFEKVWSKPMIAISKEYGLSDVGMAKLCKRHNIPRPPRGYWARIASGQMPHKAVLPQPDNDVTIQIWAHEGESALPPKIREETEPALEKIGPISVRDDLRGCHWLVGLAKEMLSNREAEANGLYILPRDAPLCLRVSKASFHRALRIMDALIKGMEDQGWKVGEGPKANVLGMDISLSLSEGLMAKTEEPEGGDLKGSYYFRHNRITHKQVPSGDLVLMIDGEYWDGRCRRKWADGIRQRLENLLPDILGEMIVIAGRRKQRQIEREEEERRREEQRQREREELERKIRLKKQIRAEQAKVDALLQEAEDWRQSRELRAYIESRKQRHGENQKGAALSDDFEKWLRWATEQADRLDPLASSPPSILDKATSDVMEAEERPSYW